MKILDHPRQYDRNHEIIKTLENNFNGKFLFWATNIGVMSNEDNKPFYIFYSETPDLEKGHTHFFKVYLSGNHSFISAADPDSKYLGIVVDDTFHFSRFRHDYQEVAGGFIDGGQAYLRSCIDGEYKEFTLKELAKVVYGLG